MATATLFRHLLRTLIRPLLILLRPLNYAALATALCIWSAGATAQLADGSYAIDGRAYASADRAIVGSFDVVSGNIANLQVAFNTPYSGTPAEYVGPGVNEPTGSTMLSGNLTLTNPEPDRTGSGFLNLSNDGTWNCGGVNSSGSTNLCQYTANVLGNSVPRNTGTYNVTLTAAAPAALPSTAVPTMPFYGLIITALGLVITATRVRPRR